MRLFAVTCAVIAVAFAVALWPTRTPAPAPTSAQDASATVVVGTTPARPVTLLAPLARRTAPPPPIQWSSSNEVQVAHVLDLLKATPVEKQAVLEARRDFTSGLAQMQTDLAEKRIDLPTARQYYAAISLAEKERLTAVLGAERTRAFHLAMANAAAGNLVRQAAKSP